MKRHLAKIAFFTTCVLASANMPFPFVSNAGIEIVPIAVWQGRSLNDWNSKLLQDLRAVFPEGKIAHAVNAAPLLRVESTKKIFRRLFADSARVGDDVLLHMAPWRSLTTHASVRSMSTPTFFGSSISDEDCQIDCGLDLSFAAFSPSEVRSLVLASLDVMEEIGFGEPKAVYFDEGLVSSEVRFSAFSGGVDQDWSGIEPGQLRDSLSGFPILEWNLAHAAGLPLADLRATQSGGLLLDHARYAIHAEFGDLESTVAVFKSAIATAKAESRVVRIPIVFNVDDLIYTHSFVGEATRLALNMAKDQGVPVAVWETRNSSWKLDKIGKIENTAVAVTTFAPADNGDEAEFMPDDEAELLMSVEPKAMAH